jgi:gliding motility-associated-like protein
MNLKLSLLLFLFLSALFSRAEIFVVTSNANEGVGTLREAIVLPYFYKWKDSKGQVIGSGSVLEKIKSGKYSLTIGDAIACSAKTFTYEVGNETSNITKPLVADVKICAPGKVHLSVINGSSGKYSLYNSKNAIVETNSKGAFDVEVTGSEEFTILLQIGACKSVQSALRVIVENEGLAKLTNTFSPNGDGFNDEWIIPGIGQYQNATVSIYNRYGSMVFQSKGYKSPFRGQNNDGAVLPGGIYYYVIQLNKGCGSQSGSLTMIR